MSTTTPSLLLATSLGLCLSTTFSIGSLTLSYAAIPALLLPSDAPLFPPLALEPGAKDTRFRTTKAPTQPLSSGVGDEGEGVLDAGATSIAPLRAARDAGTGSPATSSYLLRQWFHLFSKGMHALPPATMSAALCYAFCAVMVPSSSDATDSSSVAVKRTCYALAAAFSAGAMVFTLTALKPINSALHARVEEVVAQETQVDRDGAKTADVDDKRAETERLIREWGRMNAWRALLPLLAVAHAVGGLLL